REDIHNLAAVRAELGQMRAFRNSDKQSISELKLAKGIVFKLIEKWLFSRFCSLYPGVFSDSLKSFLGVTKWPPRCNKDLQSDGFGLFPLCGLNLVEL